MSIFRTTDKADAKICYVNLDHVRSFMPDEYGGTLIHMQGSMNRGAQNVHVRETCDDIIQAIVAWDVRRDMAGLDGLLLGKFLPVYDPLKSD